MSEFQYYEFQALDRPLSEEELGEIRRLSRRVAPTPTQAVFTYSFGDFPADPKKVLQNYFDALLYLASWGTKRLVFRLPLSLVDTETLDLYCFPEAISASVIKDYVILDLRFYEEGGFRVEGEGWLSSLVPLRGDLLRGDFRVLYLAWLKAVALEGEREGQEELVEPPVPAGLQNLTAPLKNFVQLFEIDEDLIAAAAEASAPQSTPPELELEKLIARLPEQERTDLLVRVARGEPHMDIQLTKRLQSLSPDQPGAHEDSTSNWRTVAEPLAAARERAERRRERKRQEAEQARIRKLDELARKEPQVWEQVFALIEEKKNQSL